MGEVADALRQRLEETGQAHLLHFWPQLDQQQKTELLQQLESLDLEECLAFYRACTQGGQDWAVVESELRPLAAESCGSAVGLSASEREGLWEEGLGLIAAGSVGVILLAGGQGTRLGVAYPKGQYDIGLASSASLFQLQAERILKLQELASVLRGDGKQPVIPWYIMTSPATGEDTQQFFRSNDFFGLDESQVTFFNQGVLPCFDNDGKIILEEKGKLAMAPDGNGGLYRALAKAGLLEAMEKGGVEHLHVYCVDNCLVRVADPLFLAFANRLGADAAAKVVDKTDPHEAVGVLCRQGDSVRVVEYSEIGAATAEARGEDGRLAFRSGNIANHYFRRHFLQNLVAQHLPSLLHHVANKKIPFVDLATGQQIRPSTPNGIKMELFVFDVFQFSERFGAWSVARDEEFAPLKNADSAGKDCASTARLAIHTLHRFWRHWLEQAGASVLEHGGVEISPLLSYAGEGLQAWKARTVHTPVFLLPDSHLRHS